MWKPNILCLSSLVFVIPFLISWTRGAPWYLTWNIGASIVCSQVYHGFYHDQKLRSYIKPVDMTICHLCIILHVYASLTQCKHVLTSVHVISMYMSIAYAAFTYWFLNLSKECKWHAILHLVTACGSGYFLMDPTCFHMA